MEYRESLPENCPPESAEEITVPLKVFRLVRSDPPTDDDFRSQRAEKPGRKFHGVNECIARGLSVFIERSAAEINRKKPNLKNRMVCNLELQSGAGHIVKNEKNSHCTWWPLAKFDILTNCKVEKDENS